VRYLILSDIHANLEALEAVLEHAKGKYDQILCCGDLVGYGADPNAIVEWVRDHVAVVIRGNHDKVASGVEKMEDYNPAAVLSTMWTRTVLTPENVEYLRRLPAGPVEYNGITLVHGSPADEDEYLVSVYDAIGVRPAISGGLTFFGHTHLQGGFFFRRNSVKEIDKVPMKRGEATVAIDDTSRFLINPGSVGQPRDRDPRAAYAVYSAPERLVTYYRVEYDIMKAAGKILDAKLPEPLAARLSIGS
jgi:predicted phosphodiesterase